MKPENVLCTTRTGNRIKLIDFGLGASDSRQTCGASASSAMSCSPDFHLSWGNSELETMANVTRAEYDFDDESFDQISEEAKDFIAKLLLKDKEDRMTAAQGLNHPWLRKDKKRDDTQLDKKKLKRFVIRRRWQKMVNAFLALRRMGATISPSTP
ncbi:hypothetical protein MTO96_017300 [Rhipicephalus appendiculatus]